MKTLMFLLILALPAQAGWEVQSSDTDGATVWSDEANQRATQAGDEGSFSLWIRSDQEDDYAWSLLDEVDGRPNPAFGLFESLRISRDGHPLGDLAEKPHRMEGSVHFAQNGAHRFLIEYRIRDLDDEALKEHLRATRALYANASDAREGQVFGWISILPAHEQACDARYESCLALQQGFHFGMDFQFEAKNRFTLQDRAVELVGRDRHSGDFLYRGSFYSADNDHRASIRVEGELARHRVELYLDDWQHPVVTIRVPEALGDAVLLPAGQHCLLYRLEAATPGSIGLDETRGRFHIQDEFQGPSEGHRSWPWILAALAAMAVVAWPGRRLARR